MEQYREDKDMRVKTQVYDEETLGKFNIQDLFGKQSLEEIQQKIAKATGLGLVTVDYRGEPVTEFTYFTGFCRCMREQEKTSQVCKSSDAFGSMQAVVTQKSFIYVCPCGLMEIAIPIVVKNHYLGGFLGGQVRCLDVPEDIRRFSHIIPLPADVNLNHRHQELFDAVPVYSYAHFVNITDLISLIITQLCEKELQRRLQTNHMSGEIHELEEKKRTLELELELKKLELANLNAQLNPYFLINTLNSVSNLAVIENAEKTNEMILLFAEYLKQNSESSPNSSLLSEELYRVECYLKMQKIRYGSLLNYTVTMAEKLKLHRVPGQILLPFVEQAVYYGMSSKAEGIHITVTAELEEMEIVLKVVDDGPGMNEKEIEEKFMEVKTGYEGTSIQTSIMIVRQRLNHLFGPRHQVDMNTESGCGTTSIIRLPMHFDERII